MAYLTSTLCCECGDTFMGDSLHGLATCGKCVKKQEGAAWDTHFAELDKLTFEERLRKLEETSYRRSKAKPVYVPPPVY